MRLCADLDLVPKVLPIEYWRDVGTAYLPSFAGWIGYLGIAEALQLRLWSQQASCDLMVVAYAYSSVLFEPRIEALQNHFSCRWHV